MNILLTGVAGFIGAAVGARLLARGVTLTGLDNLNSYYDVDLKKSRLELLKAHSNFNFHHIDIADNAALQKLARLKFDAVIHLAAQAGVRYSLENPQVYIDSNLVGFANVLELCRHNHTKNVIYASSSSVYGGNTKLPYAETDPVNNPLSLYAATKQSNELLARAYSNLYGMRCTGLRFFTVYGPWGRPDMAFFKFAKLIFAGQPIPIYNHGNLARDFTFIQDAVDGVLCIFDSPTENKNSALHRIYNLGTGRATALMDCVKILETSLGMRAQYEMLPMQAGDIAKTCADMGAMKKDFGFSATTTLEKGLREFANWYRQHYLN